MLNRLTNWVFEKAKWKKAPSIIRSDSTKVTGQGKDVYAIVGMHVIKISMKLNFGKDSLRKNATGEK